MKADQFIKIMGKRMKNNFKDEKVQLKKIDIICIQSSGSGTQKCRVTDIL